MKFQFAALLILSISLTAQASSELSGKFTDDHGGKHTVGALMWSMKGSGKTSNFHLLEKKAGYIVARNDGANPFNPNLFSRFDIVKQKDGSFAFCQTVPDAASKAAAEKHAPANFHAKDGKGCGGFPFSVLKPDATAKATPANEESGVVSGE
ncbi:MAG: hypothetical protein ACXVBE_14880 [Bdellovibrionota bacterium]